MNFHSLARFGRIWKISVFTSPKSQRSYDELEEALARDGIHVNIREQWLPQMKESPLVRL